MENLRPLMRPSRDGSPVSAREAHRRIIGDQRDRRR